MVKIQAKRPDSILLAIIVALLIFGILMVYDASVVYAQEVFGGKYHFLLKQLSWAIFGSLAGLFFFLFDREKLRHLAFPMITAAFFLLLFLVVPRLVSFPLYDKFTPVVNGARRWIVINPAGVLPEIPLLSRLSFQPSEFAKLALIIYMATWLAPKAPKRLGIKVSVRETLPGLLSVGLPLVLLSCLIFLEPNLATAAMVCAIGIVIYFIAGARVWPLLVAGVVVVLLGGLAIWSSPYRRARLLTLVNPAEADPLTSGYHMRQVLIALGSGGLLGVGPGESRQKYEYLPETSGDSIFAIVGEELGFVGTTLVLAVFLLLLWRCFLVVRDAPDKFCQLLACGVTIWLAVQILVNLGAMTGLLPLTGVALPLISYGGSSMIFTLAGLGILLNISAEVEHERRH